MVNVAHASAPRAAAPPSPNQSQVFVALCWRLRTPLITIPEARIMLRGSQITNHDSPLPHF